MISKWSDDLTLVVSLSIMFNDEDDDYGCVAYDEDEDDDDDAMVL